MKTLACILLFALAASASAQGSKRLEALSRIYKHNDGTRTETRKDGDKNEIHEKTYRDNILFCKRVFYCDTKGRTRQGVIYDGKMNPLASILYGYDKATDQLIEEQTYNKQGKLVRRLFYPGALKDPKYANRFVAMTIDPDDATRQPKYSTENATPTRPVQSEQKSFEPGVPFGGAAPAVPQTPAPASLTPATPAKPAPAPLTAPRKRFLQSRKS